jgi:hypothetical protein
MTDRIAAFTRAWLADNLAAGASAEADIARQVDNLAAKMTADARLQGITGGELARSFGDIDDFLTGEYQKACAAK